MKFPNVYLKYFLYETSLDGKLKVAFHIEYLCQRNGASSFPLEEAEATQAWSLLASIHPNRMLFLSYPSITS